MRRPDQWTWALLLLVLDGALTLAQNHPSPGPGTQQPEPARPLLALQLGHSGTVTRIAFSPDGKTLATASADGTVKLWDIAQRAVRATLTVVGKDFVFSPDGRRVFAVSPDHTVRSWDSRSGQLRTTVPGYSFRLSLDGRVLLTMAPAVEGSGQSGRSVSQLWDASSGRALGSLPGVDPQAVFSPDGSLLVSQEIIRRDGRTSGSTTKLWDTKTLQVKAALGQPETPADRYVSPWTFSDDGRLLGTFGGAGTPGSGQVTLWDLGRLPPEPVFRCPGSRQSLWWKDPLGSTDSVLLSPNGELVVLWEAGEPSAEGRPRGEAKVWRVSSGKLQATLSGAGLPMALSSSGDVLVTGPQFASADGSLSWNCRGPVKLWDVRSGELTASLPEGSTGTMALGFSPDGATLATVGYGDPQSWRTDVRLWSVPKGELKAQTKQLNDPEAVAFSPDGRVFACGEEGYSVRLMDVSQGHSLGVLEGHLSSVDDLALSPDRRTLGTGSPGGAVRLWDLQSGRLLAALAAASFNNAGSGRQLAFSPDGLTVATRGYFEDRTREPWEVRRGVRLWDASSGQLKQGLKHAPTSVKVLAFSPDGRVVVDGGGYATATEEAGDLWLWTLGSEQPPVRLPGSGKTVETLAFSSDSRLLATGGSVKGGSQGLLQLWDVSTGKLLASSGGLQFPPAWLALSPDGRTLASACPNANMSLWKITDGVLKATTLEGTALGLQQSGAQGLVFSPDGSTLAVGAHYPPSLWDVATAQRLTIQPSSGLPDLAEESGFVLAFSSDGKVLAARGLKTGRVGLWDVATGNRFPVESLSQLGDFPPDFARPVTVAGAAVSLRDPCDGRVLATFLPIPVPAGESVKARPDEWLVTTPEGYLDCSANAARVIRWNVSGEIRPAESYLRRFRRPDLVRQALRGERIEAREMAGEDVPPTAHFISLRYDGPGQNESVTVTVEVSGFHEPKEVLLTMNGRPLPPEQAQALKIEEAPGGLPARPIETSAKPIEIGLKAVEVETRPAESGAPADKERPPFIRRFLFRVPLPMGAERVRLRAVVHDSADLSSNSAEMVLLRSAFPQ